MVIRDVLAIHEKNHTGRRWHLVLASNSFLRSVHDDCLDLLARVP